MIEALLALPRRQREVLVLRYYFDQQEAQIADMLAISRGSVKQHASRGLARLQQLIEVPS
jgi:RNA polymerase sigma factor (sigma-70 family)